MIAVRTMDPAPLGTPERWMPASIAGAAIILDGADCWVARRQGVRLRRALRHGSRRVCDISPFDCGREGRDGTVSGPNDRRDAAIFTSRSGGCCRPCAGRCRLAARRRERSTSLRASRCSSPSPPRHPGAAESCALALGLLAFSCAADIVMLLSIPPNWVGRG
jgi:hypothetical protein